MPVFSDIPILQPTQERFYKIDHLVTGRAYKAHNELGRLFDEKIYQADLARRIEAEGLRVDREVRLSVNHENFSKNYFIDLLVESGALFEAKAKETLTERDTAQTLHYLFLADLNHGASLNFRPASVEHEFVSSHLTREKRRNCGIDLSRWDGICEEVEAVKNRMLALLRDWGACLEVSLYREALVFFAGGEATVRKSREIRVGGVDIGGQKLNMITNDICLSVTTGKQPGQFETHLKRLLRHADLTAIAWIHSHQLDVSFAILKK